MHMLPRIAKPRVFLKKRRTGTLKKRMPLWRLRGSPGPGIPGRAGPVELEAETPVELEAETPPFPEARGGPDSWK